MTKSGTRIVFLGTKGGPRVGINASNPANLVVANGTPYVIDCGMGVSRQLVSAGVPIPSVKYIFITHHHSDHNLEYGNLVYNAWAAGLSTPIHSFGPVGLEQMTRLAIVVDAGRQIADPRRHDVHLERVDAARGRGGAVPIGPVDALGGPEQLADVGEVERVTRQRTRRVARGQSGLERHCTLAARLREPDGGGRLLGVGGGCPEDAQDRGEAQAGRE